MSTSAPNASAKIEIPAAVSLNDVIDIPWWPMSRKANVIYWTCWGLFLLLMATTILADPVGGIGVVLFYLATAYGIFALVNLIQRSRLRRRADAMPIRPHSPAAGMTAGQMTTAPSPGDDSTDGAYPQHQPTMRERNLSESRDNRKWDLYSPNGTELDAATQWGDDPLSEYPCNVELPEVGEVYALPSFMEAREGSKYHVTEVGIKMWYGTERPYIKVITLDKRGRPIDRLYTDPWTKGRKPFTKGPKNQFVLKPGDTISTHMGERLS